jgi:heat shock protein HslJ
MSKNISIVAAAGLALAACQSIPDTKGDSGGLAPYKALGTEPFWSLNIDRDKMRFEHEGVVSVGAKDVQARPSFNGWRYSSAKITADVTFTPCSDGMSEFTYKDTVTVMVGKREYKGCGGGIIPPEKLDGTSWQIVSINGANIPSEREAMLRFEDGRISGTVGCNRLGAEYQFADRKLSVGPMMSTKMACPDPVGQQEYAFTLALGNLGSTEFPGDGTMVLTAKDGSRIVLRQSI